MVLDNIKKLMSDNPYVIIIPIIMLIVTATIFAQDEKDEKDKKGYKFKKFSFWGPILISVFAMGFSYYYFGKIDKEGVRTPRFTTATDILKIHGSVYMVFFIMYYIMLRTSSDKHFNNPNADSKKQSYLLDAMYYTTTTHTTVGYGDFTPKSRAARFITQIHQVIVFLITTEIMFNNTQNDIIEAAKIQTNFDTKGTVSVVNKVKDVFTKE